MRRRRFVDLILRGSTIFLFLGRRKAWGRTRACPSSPEPTPASQQQKGKLILPTDTPDQFGLKIMEFNPIPAPDPAKWELTITGLVERPIVLKAADLERLPQVEQSSRLKCVQCWSGRVQWGGFRFSELVRLLRPKSGAIWVRVDCADSYFDYVKLEELLHPRTLFALRMNNEPLTPEHGAPLRLVIPFKYGYKWSKLITKLSFTNQGGQGIVADAWPYYSVTGDVEPGYDHPFDRPGETRKINGGEITDY